VTTISVVIPARDAATTLGRCLDALAIEGVPGPAAELIVVDDGSSDATRCIAARPGTCVLAGSGQGPAAARNLGARSASGEVLIFLDADTAPLPGWLAELLAPLCDAGVVGVKGAYETRQPGLLPRFVQLEFEHKYARLAKADRVDFIDTGTAAFRREAFLAAGGFDERFPAHSAEDVELGFRMAEQGARFVFNPRARVLHQHPEHLVGYLVTKLRYGLFRARVYQRHPRKAFGDSYTPPSMALQIGLAGASVLLAVLSSAGLRQTRPLLAGALLGFGATTLPLARRAAGSDPGLAPFVPCLVFARSLAQGTGIAAGLLALAVRRR